MAGSLGSLGNAWVEVRARGDRLRRDFRRMRGQVARHASGLRKSLRSVLDIGRRIGPAVALGVGAAAASLAFLTKRAIDTADEIGKMSDALGISVEGLQELRFAASQSGVTQEEFDKGARRLAKTMRDASIGLETYARVYRELGIAVTDSEGQLRSVEEILPEIADSLRRVESATARAAIAQELFGRSGAKFLNLLEGGSEGLEEMTGLARELGTVVEESLVRQAEGAKDRLDQMARSAKGAATKLGLSLVPMIEGLGEAFERLAPALSSVVNDLLPLAIAPLGEIDERIVSIRQELAALAEQRAERTERTGVEPLGPSVRQTELEDELTKLLARRTELLEAIKRSKKASEEEAEASEEVRKARAKEVAETHAQIQAIDAEIAAAKKRLALRKEEHEATMEAIQVRREMRQLIGDTVGVGAERQIVETLKEANDVATDDLMPTLEEIGITIPDMHERGVQRMIASLETYSGEFSRALADMLVEGEFTFDQLAKSLLKSLLSVQLNKFFAGLFASLGGGPTGGGPTGTVLSSFSARQHGGPLSAGQVGLVGERGPELFIPNVSGQVLSNSDSKSAVAGGGVTVNMPLVIPAGVGAAMRQELANSRPLIKQWAREAVLEATRRGGATGRMIRGR